MADTNQLQNTLTTVANDGMKQPGTLIFALGYLVYITSQEKGSALMVASLAIVPSASSRCATSERSSSSGPTRCRRRWDR
jgi:hypothetical protein